MNTISIIGSCVSRDLFNSKFIPDWKEFFQVKAYYARTTIPSIVSKPMDYDLEVLEKNFNPVKFETVYSENAKTILQTIKLNQSDFILIDFYADAFYGTYSYMKGYYGGWSFGRLIKKNILPYSEEYKLYRYDKNSEEYFEIWCNYFDLFMDYIKRNCPNSVIIVNGVKGSNTFTTLDGKFDGIQIENFDINKVNGLWNKMDEYAKDKYGLFVVSYDKEYTLNRNYIYAGSVELVHFHQEYYDDAFKKLVEFCSKKECNNMIIKMEESNLVRNSDFEQGFKFWSRIKGNWDIIYINDKYWVKSLLSESCKWKYLWSDPIEIDNNGEKKFRLSFHFIISKNVLKTNDKIYLFAILGFKKGILKSYKDACFNKKISIQSNEYRPNREYEFSVTIDPKVKFVRIAPHVQADGILISNICMKKI